MLAGWERHIHPAQRPSAPCLACSAVIPTRALDLLSAGELHRLARLLAAATDLHQVARRIAADLQEHLDGRPTEPPPGQPAPSTATPAHP